MSGALWSGGLICLDKVNLSCRSSKKDGPNILPKTQTPSTALPTNIQWSYFIPSLWVPLQAYHLLGGKNHICGLLPFSPLPIWNVKNPFQVSIVGIVVLVFKYCLTLSTFSADISFQIWEIKFYAYYLFSPSKDTLFPWTTWPDKSINLVLLVKPLRVLVLR